MQGLQDNRIILQMVTIQKIAISTIYLTVTKMTWLCKETIYR